MGRLQDLIDQLIGEKLLYAAQLIKQKGLEGADADILLLQARVQGLEDSVRQIALQVEQLPSLSQE